jgi:hypothetical protein
MTCPPLTSTAHHYFFGRDREAFFTIAPTGDGDSDSDDEIVEPEPPAQPVDPAKLPPNTMRVWVPTDIPPDAVVVGIDPGVNQLVTAVGRVKEHQYVTYSILLLIFLAIDPMTDTNQKRFGLMQVHLEQRPLERAVGRAPASTRATTT